MTGLSQLWTIFSFINLGKEWHSAMQINVVQLSLDQRSTTGQAMDTGQTMFLGAWLSLAINE